MIDKIKISKTWYVFLLVGTIFLSYGKFNINFLYIFLGSLFFTGALTCGLTGLIIKYIRKRKRQT